MYNTLKYRILPFRFPHHFPLYLCHFPLYFSFLLCHSLLFFIIIFLSLRMSFSSFSLLSRFPPFVTLSLLCHFSFPLLPILSSIIFLRHPPFFSPFSTSLLSLSNPFFHFLYIKKNIFSSPSFLLFFSFSFLFAFFIILTLFSYIFLLRY